MPLWSLQGQKVTLSFPYLGRSIQRVDQGGLLPLYCEVIQILRCFPPLECSVLIIWDHEDGDRVGSYLGMKRIRFLIRSRIYYFICLKIILFFVGDMMKILLD